MRLFCSRRITSTLQDYPLRFRCCNFLSTPILVVSRDENSVASVQQAEHWHLPPWDEAKQSCTIWTIWFNLWLDSECCAGGWNLWFFKAGTPLSTYRQQQRQSPTTDIASWWTVWFDQVWVSVTTFPQNPNTRRFFRSGRFKIYQGSMGQWHEGTYQGELMASFVSPVLERTGKSIELVHYCALVRRLLTREGIQLPKARNLWWMSWMISPSSRTVQAENKILATEKTPPNTDIDPTVDPLTDTPRTHILAHTTCTIIWLHSPAKLCTSHRRLKRGQRNQGFSRPCVTRWYIFSAWF